MEYSIPKASTLDVNIRGGEEAGLSLQQSTMIAEESLDVTISANYTGQSRRDLTANALELSYLLSAQVTALNIESEL